MSTTTTTTGPALPQLKRREDPISRLGIHIVLSSSTDRRIVYSTLFFSWFHSTLDAFLHDDSPRATKPNIMGL